MRGYPMEYSFCLRDYCPWIGADCLKSFLSTSSVIVSSWSWRFNLVVIWDSHWSRINSYQPLPDLIILPTTFYNAREFGFVSYSNISLQNLVFFILV